MVAIESEPAALSAKMRLPQIAKKEGTAPGGAAFVDIAGVAK